MHSSIYRRWGEKAAENSFSLSVESHLLFEAQRLPRAYYLAHMSTEESAKSILLFTMSISGTPESEMPKVDKLLRNHRKKIEFLINYAEASSEELKGKVDDLRKSLVDHINDLKNDTMYVSCTGDTVSAPTEKVAAVDVEGYVQLANVLSRHANGLFGLSFERAAFE